MKKIILLLLMTASVGLICAQDSEKEQDIRRLLEVSGSGNLGIQVMQNMIGNFQQSFPEVPNAFWEEFMKEVTPEKLNDLVVPVYDKYFSHEDIKAFITFYETPAGKRLVEKLPIVMQESMKAGEIWGQELGEKVVNKMLEEGYIKN